MYGIRNLICDLVSRVFNWGSISCSSWSLGVIPIQCMTVSGSSGNQDWYYVASMNHFVRLPSSQHLKAKTVLMWGWFQRSKGHFPGTEGKGKIASLTLILHHRRSGSAYLLLPRIPVWWMKLCRHHHKNKVHALGLFGTVTEKEQGLLIISCNWSHPSAGTLLCKGETKNPSYSNNLFWPFFSSQSWNIILTNIVCSWHSNLGRLCLPFCFKMFLLFGMSH